MSDLLPPNASSGERAISNATARHGNVPVVVREMWNPDTCPSNLLAWLAWAFSVDEWDASWPDVQKRDVIKKSLSVHRHKGTIGAVRKTLGALSFDARVQEWFNQIPSGSPYTFRLLLAAEQIGVTQSGFNTLINVIQRTKNLRSHLVEIELIARTAAALHSSGCASVGNEITLNNYTPPQMVVTDTAICI